MDEAERKAFLFTNIVDGPRRKYDIRWSSARSREPRHLLRRHGRAALRDPGQVGPRHRATPIAPREVEHAACHEVVHQGKDLEGEGKGLDRLPIPISTPGFDAAPTPHRDQASFTRDPRPACRHGHLPRGAEGAGPPRGAHGRRASAERRLSCTT